MKRDRGVLSCMLSQPTFWVGLIAAMAVHGSGRASHNTGGEAWPYSISAESSSVLSEREEKVVKRIFVEDRPLPDENPCVKEKDPIFVVNVPSQTLFVCENGSAYRSYPISFGSGGVGKGYQGDRKSPLGDYNLRVWNSPGYGRVLYVDYPNADQKRYGYMASDGKRYRYTGSLVLVHGPSSNMNDDMAELRSALIRELGPNDGGDIYDEASKRMKLEGLPSVNWTAGCFAVGTWRELDEIVDFAAKNGGIKLSVRMDHNPPPPIPVILPELAPEPVRVPESKSKSKEKKRCFLGIFCG